jgi:hypothetical protein
LWLLTSRTAPLFTCHISRLFWPPDRHHARL